MDLTMNQVIFVAIIALLFIFWTRAAFRAGWKMSEKNRAAIGDVDGIFHVDTTDPDKDVFSLEVTCALGEIPEKKYLILKVENTSKTLITSSQEKPTV